MQLHRYWFEFSISPGEIGHYHSYAGLDWGCGVTAYDYDDAFAILREAVFKDDPMPEVSRVVEDIDVSELDERHVLPNMGAPSDRGIWFPTGISRCN